MPANHYLDEYLAQYLEATDLKEQPKSPLFRSVTRQTGQFSDQAMTQPDVYRMIRRRAVLAGIGTTIGCHTFRATGITAYLKMAAPWKSRSRLRRMSRRARRAYMTEEG